MDSSVHCGWFSIFVAKMIKNLQHPSPAVIENQLIKVFGKSADMNDELVLAQSFGVH